MRYGFTFIELLVSIFISSIISLALLTSLSQTIQFQGVTDNFIEVSTKLALFQHYLERDLSGAMIPVQAYEQKQQKQDREKIKPIEHIFYATQANNIFHMLTFITSNPLSVYAKGPLGKVKPKIARVYYVLERDPERSDAFILFRKEDAELSFVEKKGTEGMFKLIDGIKEMRMTYTLYRKVEKKDKEKTEKAIEHISAREWKDAEKDTKKRDAIDIPQWIAVEIVLWDTTFKQDKKYTIMLPVVAETVVAENGDDTGKKDVKQHGQAGKKDSAPAPRASQEAKGTI